MPAWFDAHSLTDTTAKQERQVDGIAESVQYIQSVLDGEVQRLDGRAGSLVLGGISQGGAIALWTLFRQRLRGVRLGGFVGASTWLPFAENFRCIFASEDYAVDDKTSEFDLFVKEITGLVEEGTHDSEVATRSCQTPVFMGHGVDDAYVDIELGREAGRILSMAGYKVQWKEYSGAELEGHWLKVPEEMDDILDFLSQLGEQNDKSEANTRRPGKEK